MTLYIQTALSIKRTNVMLYVRLEQETQSNRPPFLSIVSQVRKRDGLLLRHQNALLFCGKACKGSGECIPELRA